MTERDYINEMATVLKDYTKSKGIMASHVILEDYAEVLYNQGYRPKEEIEKETARKILKRIADECIIGIDSNLKCMADQKDINTLWHNCLGKKTACQGIYDVVIELQEEYGLEREETE
jgi:hypothetical protein